MIVPKGSITQLWYPMWGLTRNQARQPADVDADIDSCRKTETKDPSSEERDTEKY